MGLSNTIRVDGRKVLVTSPDNMNLLGSVPVIIALHGLASKAKHMRDNTGLKEVSRSNGYILVCPNGQGNLIKSWNAGSCCGRNGPPPNDDVLFIKKMLDKIKLKIAKMDTQKVFLVGMSNGAMLAHMLAFKLRNTDYNISAIATVSGTLAFDVDPGDEKHPIPVMHIHGSLDKIIPLSGSDQPGRRCKSVEETIKAWRKRNNAKSNNDAITRKIKDPNIDNTTVVVKTYPPNLPSGSPVVNVSIVNAGHTWPGHDNPPDLNVALGFLGVDLGAISRQIKAEELILQFFQEVS